MMILPKVCFSNNSVVIISILGYSNGSVTLSRNYIEKRSKEKKGASTSTCTLRTYYFKKTPHMGYHSNQRITNFPKHASEELFGYFGEIPRKRKEEHMSFWYICVRSDARSFSKVRKRKIQYSIFSCVTSVL